MSPSKKTKLKKNINNYNKFKIILLILNLIVISYSPFVRGLYFEEEQLLAEIIVLLSFSAFWVLKFLANDRKFLSTPVEYCSFALMLIYFISIFYSVSPRLALSEWLKYCMYFAVFFMITDLAATLKNRLIVLWTIIGTSMGLCVIGIDSAVGNNLVDILNKVFSFFHMHVNFFGLYVDGRIHSTLQYPNALAAYLMGVFFVSLTMSIISSKLWKRLVASICSFFFIVTIILTLSRGVMILLPLMLIVYLIVIPKGNKLRAIVISAFIVLSSLIPVAFSTVTAQSGSKLWLGILAGMGALLILSLATDLLVKFIQKVEFKIFLKPYFILGFAAVTIVSLIILSIPKELNLENYDEAKKTKYYSQKSIRLKPGNEYTIQFDVFGLNNNEDNSFTVIVSSRDNIDVVFNRNKKLVDFVGNSNGNHKIAFALPENSSMVDIRFINTSKESMMSINNAKIIDDNTGRKISDIKLAYKFIPNSYAQRFENIFASESFAQRLIYFSDGMKMFKDNWVLGSGGGAWAMLVFSYQSFLYWSTQAHAYFVQVAVETGVLGLIILILLLASIIIQFIIESKYKKEEDINQSMLRGTLLTSILAMFLHSTIDFDLSLSSVFLLLWVLMALLNSGFRHEKPVVAKNTNKGNRNLDLFYRACNIKPFNVNPIIITIVSVVILLVPALFSVALSDQNKYQKLLSEGNTEEATKYIKSAVAADNLNAKYKLMYADLLLSGEGLTRENYEMANKLVEDAQRIDRYNASTIENAAILSIKISQFDKGMELMDRSTELRPLYGQTWELKINMAYQIALAYLKNNDPDNAEKYLNSALETINEATAINKNNMDPFVFSATASGYLEKITYIKENFENLDLSQIDKIKFYSINEMDIDCNNIPDQWKIIQPEGVELEIRNGNILVNNIQHNKLGSIQTRNISLEKGKTYKIELILEKGKDVNNVLYYIPNLNKDFEKLEKVEDEIFFAKIELPANFKEDEAFLRLRLENNPQIKRLTITED